MSELLYRSDWMEISNNDWGFAYELEKAGYFDSRPLINFYATSLLGLVLFGLGLLAWGFSWVLLFACLPIFMFGRIHVFLHLPHDTGLVQFEAPQWGMYYHQRNLWFHWGSPRPKSVSLPFEWVPVRSSKMLADGSWLHSTKGHRVDLLDESLEGKFWTREYPYQYIRKNGEVQKTTARVQVEEREWRWLMFQWLPWGPFCKVNRSIHVQFADAIGEGVGTYKGGVIGTGETLRPGESPEHALRRMEQTQKFRR